MRLNRRDERWLREQIPLPLPREEMAKIHAEMTRRRDARFPYSIAFAVMIGMVALFAVRTRTLMDLPRSGWDGFLLTIGICMAVAYAAYSVSDRLLLRSRSVRLLRSILRERGHEVCLPCGYCLAGLGVDVTKCPECGAQREPMPGAKP